MLISDEESYYYVQFRELINSYSDIQLARLTNAQKEDLVSILLLGIENGDKKAELTYSFMLLTGQLVEQDEKLGKELLSKLLTNTSQCSW